MTEIAKYVFVISYLRMEKSHSKYLGGGHGT